MTTSIKRLNEQFAAYVAEHAAGVNLVGQLRDRVRELTDSLALSNAYRDTQAWRIKEIEAVLKSIAMSTEKGALYESAAIHNAAIQPLRVTVETGAAK